MVNQTSSSEFYRINDMLVEKAEAILEEGAAGYPCLDSKVHRWFGEICREEQFPVLWKTSREGRALREHGLSLWTPQTLTLKDMMEFRPLACVSDNVETNSLWKEYCSRMGIPFPLFADGPEDFLSTALSQLSSSYPFPVGSCFSPASTIAVMRREVLRLGERCALRSLLQTMVGTRKKTLYLMEHDKLTGILNRHGGEEAWKRLDHEIRELGLRYVFFIADLDHFKKVNDHFGHDYGDQVLSTVAAALAEAVGNAGFVFRFGGEEIAGFCKVVNFFDQQRFASKIMHTISDLELEAPPMTGNEVITVSVGITIFDPELNDVSREDILKQADMALYEAKDTGRNRYEVFVMNRKFMGVPVRSVRPEGNGGRLDSRISLPGIPVR